MVLLKSGQFLIAVAFLPAIVVSGNNCTNKNLGILGGHKVTVQAAPFIAALYYYSAKKSAYRPFCGGSIIHERFILTAAHCPYQKNRKYGHPPKRVLIGSDHLDVGKTFISVEKELCHDGYVSTSQYNDICLLKLKKPIQFGSKAAKVKLPDEDFVLEEGTLVNVTGFGAVGGHVVLENELRQSTIPILSSECCHEIYHISNDNELCAGTRGHGSYKGDSGGPLTYNGIQVGVVSHGKRNPERQAGVYTKVTSYLKWINTIIKENV